MTIMTDDEIMAVDIDTFNIDPENADKDPANENPNDKVIEDPNKVLDADPADKEIEIAIVPDSELDKDPVVDPVVDPDADPVVEGKTANDTKEGDDDKSINDSKKPEGDKEEKPDYEVLYNELLAPFKAAGTEHKPRNNEEARRLMQMGVGFNKKMSDVKADMKFVSILKQNDLLDMDKLTFAIDLSKNKPEAIKKLIQDSGINPLDLTDDSTVEYKPETYTVDEEDEALKEALQNIEHTNSFKDVISIVSDKWDESSRAEILKSPQNIGIISEHMETGVYAKIVSEMEHLKVQGQLNGLTDMQAYMKVGDDLYKQGAFNDVLNVPTEKKVVVPKSDNAEQVAELAKRRKAAAPTKNAPEEKAKDHVIKEGGSDADFMAQFDKISKG